MGTKIVVIGHGRAGQALTAALLAGPEDLEVVVYAGPAGTPDGGPNGSPDAVAPDVAPLAADPRLSVRHGVRAAAIDRMHRLVHGSDLWVERYDALVLATGANPVLPPIRGVRTADGTDLLPGVYSAHTAADAQAIAEASAAARRVLVIGGGAAGQRMAGALRALRPGLPVELVDQGPARAEITAADAFLALRSSGVVVYQDCRVRSLVEGRDGRVSGAVLADGFRLDCDLVVLACGTSPNTLLAWRSGLAVARGVVVDDALRSVTDPRVYALGDCAEHRRRVGGGVVAAVRQAEVLAERLSGRDRTRVYVGAGAVAVG